MKVSQRTCSWKLDRKKTRNLYNFHLTQFLSFYRPKIQEQFTNGGYFNVEEEEDSDDQDIIDYEPDFCEDREMPGTSLGSGRSPDSGIIDDRAHDGNNYERQVAEPQLTELQEILCDICNKNMFSVKGLARHKRNFHGENRCQYCRKRFMNHTQLKVHTKFKHPGMYNDFRLNGQTNPIVEIQPIQSIPECTTCGAIFYEQNALFRHHADCDKKCIECGMQFTRKDSYLTHIDKKHGIKFQEQTTLECPFGCIEKFHAEKVLQMHIQQNHPDEKDLESVADTMSDDGESVSNDSALFPCVHCSSRFSTQRSLGQHVAYKHKLLAPEPPKTRNVPKFTREEFLDKFMVRKSLDYHRCIPCKKDIHKRSMGLHLRGKHAAMKSYLCEICPEGFFRIDYRQRHMFHCHHSQYRCTECDVQFDRAYKFDAHMVQHGVPAKNLRPEEGSDRFDLSCAKMKYIEDSSTFDYSKEAMQRRPSIMSTSSVQSAQIEVPMTKDEFCEKHLITLSDKYTHCSICQQKMMKSSIISHILWKHAVKKPLKCAFCNERVVKNAARLNHMARCHPDEYKCEECNIQHAKHEAYASHMRDFHQTAVTSFPSSGEEDDLLMNDVRFVGQKNEDEVIEEPELFYLEPEVKIEHGESSMHQCPLCPKTFATSKNLQIHKTSKHRGGSVETVTSKPVEDFLMIEPMTFEEFRHNYVETVSNLDVKCIVCDQTMKKRNYGNHIKSRHATTGAYKCAICPEDFFRPEHRIQHMSNIHRGMFFCHTCNIQFYQNSRYAKHMKDMHEIEVDASDNYEVDLNLADLRFLPQVKPANDDDQNLSVPSIVHEMEVEVEVEEETETISGALTRDEFIERYVQSVSKDNRKCNACDKVLLKGSLYNHLMRYHALTLPFKCPFCDLRLERAQYRIRHLQIFHPDEYKCNECGLQFQNHSKFAEHMTVEHNSTEIPRKSEGEERDLSSYDIKYVAHRSGEEDWQDDEQVDVKPEVKDSQQFLKPQIKEEPKDNYAMHSVFGGEESLLEEQLKPFYGDELNYNDFKSKYMVEADATNLKCVPCDRLVIKTSACAHLRLWHAITMCYNCELCPDGFQRVDYRQRHMKFNHPDDYKCSLCDFQFHRSTLYKSHMLENHKIRVDVKELKAKDDIDVPLENMKFVEHVPEHVRVSLNDHSWGYLKFQLFFFFFFQSFAETMEKVQDAVDVLHLTK
jgi:Zinc finger, C2H2 type